MAKWCAGTLARLSPVRRASRRSAGIPAPCVPTHSLPVWRSMGASRLLPRTAPVSPGTGEAAFRPLWGIRITRAPGQRDRRNWESGPARAPALPVGVPRRLAVGIVAPSEGYPANELGHMILARLSPSRGSLAGPRASVPASWLCGDVGLELPFAPGRWVLEGHCPHPQPLSRHHGRGGDDA